MQNSSSETVIESFDQPSMVERQKKLSEALIFSSRQGNESFQVQQQSIVSQPRLRSSKLRKVTFAINEVNDKQTSCKPTKLKSQEHPSNFLQLYTAIQRTVSAYPITTIVLSAVVGSLITVVAQHTSQMAHLGR